MSKDNIERKVNAINVRFAKYIVQRIIEEKIDPKELAKECGCTLKELGEKLTEEIPRSPYISPELLNVLNSIQSMGDDKMDRDL